MTIYNFEHNLRTVNFHFISEVLCTIKILNRIIYKKKRMRNALLRLSCALIGLLSEKVAERNYYKASYLNWYIYIWIIIPLVTIRCCVRWINGDWNIFFAYAPSRINKNIHMTAIKFVKIAFLIQQLTLFFFSLLRGGLQGVAIFALVRFCS